MQVNVKQVIETATRGRYRLKLSCGHDKYVTRPERPTRKVISCGVCAFEAGKNAAELELARREREMR